jgi:ribosome-binding protein aMBF1 (putative translation factor)
MDSQPYPASDKREQEQLEIIRARIEDATRDTTLWVQADSSAEERAHVFAIQTGLADLARIIERRMERRKLPADQWGWSEGVGEVLSRLDKAREARGSIVGKGLARLAEHLPRELPGSKARIVTKAPAPITPVGLGLAPYRPKPTRIPPNPSTYFPGDLWPQTNVILLEACGRKFPLQTQTFELCKHVVAEMTPIFVEAVKAAKMEAGAVQRENGGGMEDLLHSLLVYNDDGPKSGFSSLSDQAYRLGQRVRESDEWLALAKVVAEAQHSSMGAGRNANQMEGSRVQNSATSAQRVSAEPSADTAEGKSTNPADGARVRIGQNINKLRKECGWSFDVLAEKTGIDKKAILAHVHGKSKPNPGTQKEYAQAFTKELNRSITANNLEE